MRAIEKLKIWLEPATTKIMAGYYAGYCWSMSRRQKAHEKEMFKDEAKQE